MTAHAKLSASGSSRWLSCPASIQAEEGKEDKPSREAVYGSAAHKLAEHCLRGEMNPASFLNWTYCSELDDLFVDKSPRSNSMIAKVDDEMVVGVQKYIDYVREIQGDDLAQFEVRVDFSEFVPDGFGTADVLIPKTALRKLHVIDLKFGQGVVVYATDNSQLKLYGIGGVNEYDFICEFDTVVLHIFQPRRDHIDTFEISVDELLEWGNYVSERAVLALGENPPFGPSDDACRWCSAAPCRAQAEHALSIATDGFESILQFKQSPPKKRDASQLTNEELELIKVNAKLISSFLSSVDNALLNELLLGEELEHFKLVEQNKHRTWVDAEKAQRYVQRKYSLKKADVTTEKFKSPPQIIELVNGEQDKKLQALITKPEGEKVIASKSDKRPAIKVNVTEGFDTVEKIAVNQ